MGRRQTSSSSIGIGRVRRVKIIYMSYEQIEICHTNAKNVAMEEVDEQ